MERFSCHKTLVFPGKNAEDYKTQFHKYPHSIGIGLNVDKTEAKLVILTLKLASQTCTCTQG